MTEDIRSALESGSFTCGIFAYFQKAVDTVKLLKNLNIMDSEESLIGFVPGSRRWLSMDLNQRRIFSFTRYNKAASFDQPYSSFKLMICIEA